MKFKGEQIQSKMDEYLKKRNYLPQKDSKIKPEGSKNRQFKNEKVRKEQQQEVKLQVYENKKIYRTCHSFLLITPADTIFYQPIIKKKLIQLTESYSKQALVHFILHNLKYSKITNVKNLLQINYDSFWDETAPTLIKLALKNINEISCQIRILSANASATTKLSRLKILTILSCMFFGIFPKQQFQYQTNFGQLMTVLEDREKNTESALMRKEKLKCIMAYLKIMVDHQEIHSESVVFQRYCTYDNSILRLNQEITLSPVEIVDFSDKAIEDYYCEGVMVDFANKKIGGGILKNGCVQQEIMFSIFPQAIVSKLLCPEMQDNEAIVIYGARKYSFTKGYQKSFEFDQEFFIDTEHHNYGNSVIVAIDALNCNTKYNEHPLDQYCKKGIRREIIKACTGFGSIKQRVDFKMPICTGKWGCGAFNGDEDLKFIIQWLACSLSRRSMIYISADKQKSAEYRCLARQLSTYSTNEVLSLLDEYYLLRQKLPDNKNISLFSFLKNYVL